MLHADEYIACLSAGKKPFLAIAGPLHINNGFVSATGRCFLDIDGSLYEVKPDFALLVQWSADDGK
ncbi:MAG: hypothetical protein IT297_04515 [Anaerolineae bacterium]|jgi:hypothetical protein|nr:hypothetical protein [Anaerolineae bacterium]MCZ7553582.1 hypothetical protein [Anaerolineales bacterium]